MTLLPDSMLNPPCRSRWVLTGDPFRLAKKLTQLRNRPLSVVKWVLVLVPAHRPRPAVTALPLEVPQLFTSCLVPPPSLSIIREATMHFLIRVRETLFLLTQVNELAPTLSSPLSSLGAKITFLQVELALSPLLTTWLTLVAEQILRPPCVPFPLGRLDRPEAPVSPSLLAFPPLVLRALSMVVRCPVPSLVVLLVASLSTLLVARCISLPNFLETLRNILLVLVPEQILTPPWVVVPLTILERPLLVESPTPKVVVMAFDAIQFLLFLASLLAATVVSPPSHLAAKLLAESRPFLIILIPPFTVLAKVSMAIQALDMDPLPTPSALSILIVFKGVSMTLFRVPSSVKWKSLVALKLMAVSSVVVSLC